jgi:hypothetical protein
MSKNIKSKKNKSRKYKLKRRQTKRKRHGGKDRVEKIVISFGRKHTGPDIRKKVQFLSGPTTQDTEIKGAYLSNFIKHAADNFEEDIAVNIRGVPKSKTTQKIITFKTNDNDAPLEKGSTKAVKKCKSSTNKEKKEKKE